MNFSKLWRSSNLPRSATNAHLYPRYQKSNWRNGKLKSLVSQHSLQISNLVFSLAKNFRAQNETTPPIAQQNSVRFDLVLVAKAMPCSMFLLRSPIITFWAALQRNSPSTVAKWRRHQKWPDHDMTRPSKKSDGEFPHFFRVNARSDFRLVKICLTAERWRLEADHFRQVIC